MLRLYTPTICQSFKNQQVDYTLKFILIEIFTINIYRYQKDIIQIQSVNSMDKQLRIAVLVVICCISVLGTSKLAPPTDSDPEDITKLELNSELTRAQSAGSLSYYSVDIETSLSDDDTEVLLITVSANTTSYIGIYISRSNAVDFKNNTHPTWLNHSHECFYRSIDTCAIRLFDGQTSPPNNYTLYIGVETSDSCSYILSVSKQPIYNAHTDRKYIVTFKDAESAILSLPMSEFYDNSSVLLYEQIIIQGYYTSYTNMGQFEMIADVDQLPDQFSVNWVRAESLTAFSKVLKLRAPAEDTNITDSQYYVLIEGQNNTVIQLSIQGLDSVSSPSLSMNSSIMYITQEEINYTVSTPMRENNSMDLLIDLYGLRRFGKFEIDYCNQLLNFTFENRNGENGEFVVPAQERQKCYEAVEGEGGLLIENIVIAIVNVWDFGYKIEVQEGSYQLSLYPGQKEYGILLSTPQNQFTTKEYQLINFAGDNQTDNQPMRILAKCVIGNFSLFVKACAKDEKRNGSCTQLPNSSLSLSHKNQIESLSFACPSGNTCYLQISNQLPQNRSSTALNNAEYVVWVSVPAGQSTPLKTNVQHLDVIQSHQYNYYLINISDIRRDLGQNFSNSTQISIIPSVVNGKVVIFSSLQETDPGFSSLLNASTDVKISFGDPINYIFSDQSDNDYLYVSVEGQAESVYYIEYIVNTSANVPERYRSILDDAGNQYELTPQMPYILLKYSSHILPYSILFEPMPDCVKYSTQLPIDLSSPCQSVPKVLHNKTLYFNVSGDFMNKQDQFKFSIYANSGDYLLWNGRPVLIGCLEGCYELVSVLAQQQEIKIIHSGAGSIEETPLGQSKTSNGILTLTCTLPPCSFTLNASLPWGGQMQIEYYSTNKPHEMKWRVQPYYFNNESNRFYMHIPYYYRSPPSMIFYTEAISLEIFYNVISLDEQFQNTQEYTYPTFSTFDRRVEGDPLQSLTIVEIDAELLDAKKCSSYNVICVVTAVLMGNPSVEYSQQYMKKGLAYYSSSSFLFSIEINKPITLKQSYSLNYFAYLFPEDRTRGRRLLGHSSESLSSDRLLEQSSPAHYIHLHPLSECRPKIQLQSSTSNKYYYTNVQLPERRMGQWQITYTAISQQLCLFATALTNVDFPVALSNVRYQYSPSQRTKVFVYYNEYETEFRVQVLQKYSNVSVCQLSFDNETNQPVLPNSQNNMAESDNSSSLASESSYLVSNPKQQTSYLIQIKLPDSFGLTVPSSISMMVYNPSKPIIMLHNQVQQCKFPKDSWSPRQYSYHSQNNVLLFIAVNRHAVNLTVFEQIGNFESGRKMIMTTQINNQSLPWIAINNGIDEQSVSQNVNNRIRSYLLRLTMLENHIYDTSTTVTMHAEEDGIEGLSELYNGIIFYDAFVQAQATNCYKYTAPLAVGNIDNVVIDLSFVNPDGLDLEDRQTSQPLKQATVTLPNSIKKLNTDLQQISNDTFRLTTDFLPQETYKICFTSNSPNLIGQEYALLINVPNMPVIYNEQLSQKYDNKTDYNIYQYVNHQAVKHIQISLTNCLGKSQILASSSYQDLLTGQMTEVKPEWEWHTGGVGVGIASVPHGYYYLGVKSLHSSMDELYELSVRDALMNPDTSKPVILQTLFGINWSLPVETTSTKRGEDQFVVLKIPPITPAPQFYSNLIESYQIEYSLYLMNLHDEQVKKLPYSIDTYTKCPSLLASQHFQPIVVNSSNSQQHIHFQIPLEQFKPDSNLSVRGEVTAKLFANTTNSKHRLLLDQDNTREVKFAYYYGFEEITIRNNDSFGFLFWFILTDLLILVSVIVFLGVRKYIQRRRGAQITFEASRFQNGEVEMENQNSNDKRMPLSKPQNAQLGYGQFVDEAS